MIAPEELEAAEANGYYNYTKNVEDGLNLTNRVDRETPNFYSLIEHNSHWFTERNGRIEPTTDEIAFMIILDGHTKGRNPQTEKSYDVTLSICCEGYLEVEDGEVVGGDMEMIYNYYL